MAIVSPIRMRDINLPKPALTASHNMLFSEMRNALSEFYDEAEIEVWLFSAHEMLDGHSAFDLVTANRGDKVLTLIHGWGVGAYL
jgi:uncharacterized protein (DUF2384 family)